MKKDSTAKKLPAKKDAKENSFPVVAIGASAGGLEAMMELLKHLPSETGMAFIYVQHLSPDHKSMLTEILSKKTEMRVQEIDDMDKLQPDSLFIIPYNKGIEVTDGHIKLIPRSESSTAISIDILFSSLAQAQKERVIGIILSGSGSDGTVGIKDIKHEGGLTFAQDDTAKFTSMPHAAIAAGAVDYVLSPKEIALELGRLSKHPLIRTMGIKKGGDDLIENSNPDLKSILNQLHKVTGVDFSAYKMNTIKRRITRRMLLYKIKSLKDYAKLLLQKNEEIDILYQDLLINVTSFFRYTESHHYLKETLLPKLLDRKKRGESLRIWVPACATGEEAYSIAMMLLEIQGDQQTKIPVQIFATDLSEHAINKARTGTYTEQELESVSPKRIKRFFTKHNGSFRIDKTVRDICVFAPHNILRDPPFSRLDFISCCNLFIYFDTAAQKKAVTTFHFALNDDGFLMLGKLENISHSTHLFTAFNKNLKLFSRKLNSGTRTMPALLPPYSQENFVAKNVPKVQLNKVQKSIKVNDNGLEDAIDAVLVSEFMPVSVVINHHMEIVQFRGTTDVFLTHPKGKATFNILKMARPELAFELRNAISKVMKTDHRIRKSGIELKVNSAVKIISIEVVPLKIEWDEPLLLILFTEQEQIEVYSEQVTGGNTNSLAKDRRIEKLELQLAAAHDDALTMSQEQEAFTEELQSANEEIVSSNEELQTVNEELETSKEEIESSNEELTTTNQELQTRNDLLNESYEYSDAIVSTMHDSMLVLGKGLHVKSANKAFYKKFGVTKEQTEGVRLYDLGNRQWNIPALRELLEDIIPKNSQFDDFEVAHNFLNLGEKVMLLNASRLIQKSHGEELILLSINDVTEQAIATRKVIESEQRFRNLIYTSPSAIGILLGEDLVITTANEPIIEIWGKGKEIMGKNYFEALPELAEQGYKDVFKQVYKTGIPFNAIETPVNILQNGVTTLKYYNFILYPQRNINNEVEGIGIIATEVTSQAILNQKIKVSEEHFRLMADLMPAKISNANEDGDVTYFNKHWLDFSGYTFEELKDFGYHQIMHPEEVEEFQQRLQKAAETGTDLVMEMRFKNKQGDYIWHLNMASPIKDINGALKMWVGVTTEIQHQKEQREALEHAVDERTLELSETNQELKKMNKELEAFNYVSSHDLQEPLRKIQTFAGRLLEKENENLSDSGKNYFNLMRNAAERMQTLIRDLLAFSRITMAERTFETTDLNSIIKDVKKELKEAIAEKNAVIEVKEICDLKIIPFQFRQLMHNLIGNALKFSNPKIPPHILIKCHNIQYAQINIANLNHKFGQANIPPQKEYCHISVSDNGIGFEKEFAEKIFEVFQKLHAKEEYAGTGIGLAIVKKIVDNHNGIITATSKLKKGTTFDIYIPL